MDNSNTYFIVFKNLSECDYIALSDVSEWCDGSLKDAFDVIKFLVSNGAVKDVGKGKFKVIADEEIFENMRREINCYKRAISEERLQEIADTMPLQLLSVLGFLERNPGSTYVEIRDFVREVVEKDPLYYLAESGIIVAVQDGYIMRYYNTIPTETLNRLPHLLSNSIATNKGIGLTERFAFCGFDSWEEWHYGEDEEIENQQEVEIEEVDLITRIMRKMIDDESSAGESKCDESDDYKNEEIENERKKEYLASKITDVFKDRTFPVVFENSKGVKLAISDATIHGDPYDWLKKCVMESDDATILEFFGVDVNLPELRKTECIAISLLIGSLTLKYNDEVGEVNRNIRLDTNEADNIAYRYLMRYGALKFNAEVDTSEARLSMFRFHQKRSWCYVADVPVTLENEEVPGVTLHARVRLIGDAKYVVKRAAYTNLISDIKPFLGKYFTKEKDPFDSYLAEAYVVMENKRKLTLEKELVTQLNEEEVASINGDNGITIKCVFKDKK